MTDKQNRFVQEYLITLNATEAAKRAGYSERTAYSLGQRLMKTPEVQEAIIRAMNERAKRTELTQDYIISNLLEIVERGMQRSPVMNAKGEQIQDAEGRNVWCYDARNSIKALELLGRHIGLFDYKLQLQQNNSGSKIIYQWIGEDSENEEVS